MDLVFKMRIALLIFLDPTDDLFPLCKHVKVKLWKNGHIRHHHHDQEHRKVKGEVPFIGHGQTEHPLFPSRLKRLENAPQFARHAHGIQDNEESVSEPDDNGGFDPHQIEGVEGVSDDFGDDPGQEQQRETGTQLGFRKHGHDGPGHEDARKHLHEGQYRV